VARPLALAVAGVVALAGLLRAGLAAACSPCTCDGESGVQVFPRASSALPQNASFLVWAPEHAARDIRLVRASDGGSDTLSVRVSVLDGAGNASEPEALRVHLERLGAPGCGDSGDCHVAEARAGASRAACFMPLGAAVLWLRRRRATGDM